MNKPKKTISEEEGLYKAQRFCAYQERCVYELEIKLKEWGVPEKKASDIIDQLVEDNFINEQRFTMAYVRGKFRIKGWGKRKIKAGLIEKRIAADLIYEGLQTINELDYEQMVLAKAEQWIHSFGLPTTFAARNKLIYHLGMKGFEQEVIFKVLKAKGL
jgi:regulatory protein